MHNLKNFADFSLNESKKPKYLNFTGDGRRAIENFLNNLLIFRNGVDDNAVRYSASHYPENFIFDTDEIKVHIGTFKIENPNIDGSVHIVEKPDENIVKISFRENRPIPLPPVISAYIFHTTQEELEELMEKIGNWNTEIWDLKKVKLKIMGGQHKL